MTAGTNQKLEFSRSQIAMIRVIENEATMTNSFLIANWVAIRIASCRTDGETAFLHSEGVHPGPRGMSINPRAMVSAAPLA
tara:strand:+ start:160 stop:402 length:243 start_codon:yes stop_codon:yes gene_type:complete